MQPWQSQYLWNSTLAAGIDLHWFTSWYCITLILHININWYCLLQIPMIVLLLPVIMAIYVLMGEIFTCTIECSTTLQCSHIDINCYRYQWLQYFSLWQWWNLHRWDKHVHMSVFRWIHRKWLSNRYWRIQYNISVQPTKCHISLFNLQSTI